MSGRSEHRGLDILCLPRGRYQYDFGAMPLPPGGGPPYRHTAIQRYRFFVEQATDWLLKKLIDQRMADRKRVVNVRQRIRCKLLYGAYVFLIFFPPTGSYLPTLR
jgi:hypothetical protein